MTVDVIIVYALVVIATSGVVSYLTWNTHRIEAFMNQFALVCCILFPIGFYYIAIIGMVNGQMEGYGFFAFLVTTTCFLVTFYCKVAYNKRHGIMDETEKLIAWSIEDRRLREEKQAHYNL